MDGMDGWMDGMDGWMDGMDGWMDGMDGWMDGWIGKGRKVLKKALRASRERTLAHSLWTQGAGDRSPPQSKGDAL